METTLIRRRNNVDDNATTGEPRSHLVHRAGDTGVRLFPGWGPKA